MTEDRTLPPVLPVSHAPAYIGPLFRADAVALRYGAAIVVVLVIAGVRALLAPLLGTQAPLLPFVLGVFAAAYLGGRGPALLASVLTPLLATWWFTNWPQDAPPMQWISHVVFFLLIAALSSQLMHELQKRSRTEREALAIAAEPRAGAARSRPAQGRVPGHAGARVAQSAGAHPQRRLCARERRRRSGHGPPLGADDRAPGQPPHASRRRSARRGADHARPRGAETRIVEPRHRGRVGARNRAAAARCAQSDGEPASARRSRSSSTGTACASARWSRTC